MGQYTIQGYIEAVNRRSKKTILVEGASDKKILARIFQNFDLSDSLLIDSAELIKSDGSVVGNRALAEEVHRLICASTEKFAALVDREYRSHTLGPYTESIEEVSTVIRNTCYWTHGHSIENYFFVYDIICETLLHLFPEKLPHGWKSIIQKGFSELITFCAALSVALYKTRLLEASSGALKRNIWISGNNIDLNVKQLLENLLARKIDKDKLDALEEEIIKQLQYLKENVGPQLAQWLVHGHLGFEGIWAGVARMLEDAGIDTKSSDAIESGFRDEKLRTAASQWATMINSGTSLSPKGLWEWAKTRIVT